VALWRRYGYSEERFSGVLSDHWHIIKALDENDVAGTGTLVGAHVIKARRQLLDAIRQCRHQDVGNDQAATTGAAA
jgi:DNA-binding GntR family transcriptional regulator